MPQYYNSANPSTAASEGLMAGFEFVDRIQQRRRALELEERQQNRADRGMALAENADQRAQAAFEINDQERIRDNTREDVVDTRNTTLFDQQQSEFERSKRVRDDVEGARRTLAEGMSFGGGASLQAIGAAGAQARAPAPPNVPQNGQPSNVPQSAPPAGPVDLRAAQIEKDNAPNFVERLAQSVLGGPIEKSATKLWDSVADPNDNGAAILQGRGKAVTTADIRRNPAQYADKYISEREKVSPAARASLDVTMANALKDELKTATPARAKAINNQLGTLAKASTNSAAADAGITRPVKIDDTRVVPAITNGAAKARAAQNILETSPDELRAAMTVATRAGSAKRLNEKQISALTTLYAHGSIDAEQLQNWSKFGQPLAPKQPTVQPLGNGYAAVVSESGISLLRLPGDAKGETAASQSNRRLLVNDRLKQLDDGLKGMVEAGELSDGSPNQHFTKFLQILKREAPNLQLQSGIPLLGADGALNLAEADPGEVAELLSSYAAYDKGEEQPWFFKGGKKFSEYAPQPGGEEILDLTGAF